MERGDTYGRDYQAFSLQPGEVVGFTWTASQGKLALTSQRLLYEPIQTPKALIEPLAGVLGYGAVGKLISAAIDVSGALKAPWSVPLAEIASVEATGRAGLRVILHSNESHELEIAQSLFSPRFSPSNSIVRDEAVGAIQTAMGGAFIGGLPAATLAGPEAFFIGAWRVSGMSRQGELGSLLLGADASFSGTFPLFGTAPAGSPVQGAWWLASPIPILVLQGRVVEAGAGIMLPFQPIVGIEQISFASISGVAIDEQDLPVVLTRVNL